MKSLTMDRHPLLRASGVLAASIVSATLHAAPAVWTGLTHSFAKMPFADPTLPENQDHITENVALTRGDMAGLYNAAAESSYDRATRISPVHTEWATDINNPGRSIAAQNWAALEFATWSIAYGNQVGGNIVDRNAVLHLIPDDVYLDFRFTSWLGGELGGAFSYRRAAEPLSVSGDYNSNRVVDAADYVLWRDTFNQMVAPGSGADGSGNGTIDTADYNVWRSHFGDPVAKPAHTLQIPEPTSATSICWVTAGVLWMRYKRSMDCEHRSVTATRLTGRLVGRKSAGQSSWPARRTIPFAFIDGEFLPARLGNLSAGRNSGAV